MYKLLRVGLFICIRDCELGLDCCELGLFYFIGYSIMIVDWFSMRGIVDYGFWLVIIGNGMLCSYVVWDNGWKFFKLEVYLESDVCDVGLIWIIIFKRFVL